MTNDQVLIFGKLNLAFSISLKVTPMRYLVTKNNPKYQFIQSPIINPHPMPVLGF